jgi:hypothetical protein
VFCYIPNDPFSTYQTNINPCRQERGKVEKKGKAESRPSEAGVRVDFERRAGRNTKNTELDFTNQELRVLTFVSL